MLLFKPEHVPMILHGRKTQTRRLWKKPRVKVGALHLCYTRPAWLKENPGKPFARVKITALRQEILAAISNEDVRREGYETWDEYTRVFSLISGMTRADALLSAPWVVDFELVEPLL